MEKDLKLLIVNKIDNLSKQLDFEKSEKKILQKLNSVIFHTNNNN